MQVDFGDTLFRTVIDVGLMHTFNRDGVKHYLTRLRGFVELGGKVFVMCFSDSAPDNYQQQYSEVEVRGMFGFGWNLIDIVRVRFDIRDSDAGSGPAGWIIEAVAV